MTTRQGSNRVHASTSGGENADILSQTLLLIIESQEYLLQGKDIVPFLCNAVKRISQGYGQLVLWERGRNSLRPLQEAKAQFIIFPVSCGTFTYGNLLCVSSLSFKYDERFFQGIQMLARVCGVILYTLEHILLVRREQDKYDLRLCETLTKKEREVLALLARGLTIEDIAGELAIKENTVRTHRQRIFSKLNVKCENDAVIMGYCAGLFSPLKMIIKQVNMSAMGQSDLP